MSKRWGDWGNKTLCGRKFARTSNNLTNSIQWVNCQTCLKEIIAKREKELDYLKWALNDRKKLGELRVPNKERFV